MPVTGGEERVRRLAEAAGIEASAGRAYDWAAIEGGLGVRLPSDYKRIAESFPEGWFRLFAEVRLPDSESVMLDEFALDVLRTMQEVGEDEEEDCPFRAYPEPGGLLLCGWLRGSGFVFWVTGPGDPDEWPLVLLEETYDYWERFEGTLSQFLTEVALGRFDASRFHDGYQWQGQKRIDILSRPVFGPDPVAAEPAPVPVPAVPGPDFWERVSPVREWPRMASSVPALREVIGPPTGGAAAVDWDAVHAGLGFALPSDYREFIDLYGPGTLGAVRIHAPGAPGDWDLFRLLAQRYAHVQRAERGPRDVPCHPEAAGVVSWGVLSDGRTLAWARVGPDPDAWPVVLLRANAGLSLNAMQQNRASFSAVLLGYAEHAYWGLLRFAEPGEAEVRFVSCRE